MGLLEALCMLPHMPSCNQHSQQAVVGSSHGVLNAFHAVLRAKCMACKERTQKM